MKGLNSYVWIGFGALIAVFSKIFGKGAFYDLFFYIGLAFVAIGLLKLVFKNLKKKPNKENPKVRNCTKCGTKNHTISNYCHKCGQPLGPAKP